MLISETKPPEEIREILDGEDALFIVGCSGCAEVCDTGGEEQVGAMADALSKEGKHVTGKVSVDFLCSKALAGIRLRPYLDSTRWTRTTPSWLCPAASAYRRSRPSPTGRRTLPRTPSQSAATRASGAAKSVAPNVATACST